MMVPRYVVVFVFFFADAFWFRRIVPPLNPKEVVVVV